MFGFGVSSSQPPYRVVPVIVGQDPVKGGQLLDGVQLIAKEDIYATTAGRAVLLIRAGNPVSEEMLPKLIRHGAEPHQFVLRARNHGGDPAKFPQEAGPTPTGMTNPLKELHMSRERETIVVAEPDPKSLKRLMDGLTAQGVHTGDIQTVRSVEQLDWALGEKNPFLLIIDHSFIPMTGMFPVLRQLRERHRLQQIILTLPKTEDELTQRLAQQAEENDLSVVYKPVGPFALKGFLKPYAAHQAWGKAQREVLGSKSVR